MGAADIILDLVSTGVTLRENNLKTVKGGEIMDVRSCLSAPASVVPLLAPDAAIASHRPQPSAELCSLSFSRSFGSLVSR
jgi:hypothetical protein